VFTHTPLHASKPPGHLHMPFVQLVPPVHLTPQAPQLSGSLFRFRQAPPHEVDPVQVATHWPPLQDWPAAHFMPHRPQFNGSVLMSVQTPVQAMRPASHPQIPLRHA
jgi:hypothetical protein